MVAPGLTRESSFHHSLFVREQVFIPLFENTSRSKVEIMGKSNRIGSAGGIVLYLIPLISENSWVIKFMIKYVLPALAWWRIT